MNIMQQCIVKNVLKCGTIKISELGYCWICEHVGHICKDICMTCFTSILDSSHIKKKAEYYGSLHGTTLLSHLGESQWPERPIEVVRLSKLIDNTLVK